MQEQSQITQSLSQKAPEEFRRYYNKLDPLLSKPKNRAYTTTILSFLLMSLFLWYAIRPTIRTILELRREIRDNIDVNMQMEEKISALIQAQATYQQIGPKLPLLTQAIPQNPDIIPALLEMSTLANVSNASISGAQSSQFYLVTEKKDEPTALEETPDTKVQFSEVGVSLSVDGTYPSIKAFLDGLLEMRRIVRVSSFFITPVGDAFGEPMLRLTIRVHAVSNPKKVF